MQHPALACVTRSAVPHVLDAVGVLEIAPTHAMALAMALAQTHAMARVGIIALEHVAMSAGKVVLTIAPAGAPPDAITRVGIVAQVVVAVPGHKILTLIRDVGIIAAELALVAVGLAPDVQVFIPYRMYIDFLGGKMIKIEISKELSDYIESLQFEVNRTKEIVAFMLSSPGYDTHTNTFAQWEKDNQEAYAKLCLAKNKLEHDVIPKLLPKGTGAVRSWSLDFYTHEVIVEAADAQEN